MDTQSVIERLRRASAPSFVASRPDVEVRTFALDEVRIEAREDGKGQRVVGHAAVFDVLSEDLGGFREKISKGAFSEAVTRDDVRALFNHDENHVLGRNRAGTLALAEDDVGLKTVIELPQTTVASDLAELMRRGDVNQMSFAFEIAKDGQDWEKKGDKDWIRTINKVRRLWDVSIVTYPAYPQTEAALRSLAEREDEAARAALTEARAKHTEIQTVVFSKSKSPGGVNGGKGWTVSAARSWLGEHDLKSDKVDETEDSLRFRQFDPGRCKDGTYKTLTENFPAGVAAVVCEVAEAESKNAERIKNMRRRLSLAAAVC